MKYLVIQICCFDCNSINAIYITDSDFYDFIESLSDYKEFSYFVIDSNFTRRFKFDGSDI